MPTSLLALFFQVYSMFVLENKINLVLYRNSEPGSGFIWGWDGTSPWTRSYWVKLPGKAIEAASRRTLHPPPHKHGGFYLGKYDPGGCRRISGEELRGWIWRKGDSEGKLWIRMEFITYSGVSRTCQFAVLKFECQISIALIGAIKKWIRTESIYKFVLCNLIGLPCHHHRHHPKIRIYMWPFLCLDVVPLLLL